MEIQRRQNLHWGDSIWHSPPPRLFLAYKNKIMYVIVIINKQNSWRRNLNFKQNLRFVFFFFFLQGKKTGSSTRRSTQRMAGSEDNLFFSRWIIHPRKKSLWWSPITTGENITSSVYSKIYCVPGTVLEAGGYNNDQSRLKQRNSALSWLTFWWREWYGEDKHTACQILIHIMKNGK